MIRRAVLFLGLVVLGTGTAFAQQAPPASAAPVPANRNNEEGRPFIRAYQPLEIGGGSQTWCIVQDRRGVLYFGTNAAVLEFDGVSWRRIQIGDNAGSVRALGDRRQRSDLGRDRGQLRLPRCQMPAASSGTSAWLDRLPRGCAGLRRRVATLRDATMASSSRPRAPLFVWAHEKMSVIQTTTRFGRASLGGRPAST